MTNDEYLTDVDLFKARVAEIEAIATEAEVPYRGAWEQARGLSTDIANSAVKWRDPAARPAIEDVESQRAELGIEDLDGPPASSG